MQAPLRFGIVGLGYFGKNYARLLRKMPGVTLKAVSSRSQAAFRKYAVFLSPLVRKHTSAGEIFRAKDIDCVIIATPPSTHFAMAREALKHKKHVLVEKPFVLRVKDALALGRLAKAEKRTIMIGHQYLYNDHVRYLKHELAKGKLGRIRYVLAEHFYPGPIRSDVGCFWETATHELAILDYLFGPLKVSRVAGGSVSLSTKSRDDFSSAFVRFRKGPALALAVSWFSPEKIRRMIFAGEKGWTVFDDRAEVKLKFYLHPYPRIPRQAKSSSYFFDPRKIRFFVPRIRAGEPLRNELEHFVSCVRKNRVPLTDASHGVRITRMLENIQSKLK